MISPDGATEGHTLDGALLEERDGTFLGKRMNVARGIGCPPKSGGWIPSTITDRTLEGTHRLLRWVVS
jgi:hypothetical protein